MSPAPRDGWASLSSNFPAHVFVDYTSAAAVKANVLAAIRAGLHVVIGSSGLSDDDFRLIDSEARARKVGVVAVGNFAISAALLQKFAVETAKHFEDWEIIDTAYAGKMDAPSGMARELAWRMSEVASPHPGVAIDDTVHRGTLLAIRRAPAFTGVVRGLDRIL